MIARPDKYAPLAASLTRSLIPLSSQCVLASSSRHYQEPLRQRHPEPRPDRPRPHLPHLLASPTRRDAHSLLLDVVLRGLPPQRFGR